MDEEGNDVPSMRVIHEGSSHAFAKLEAQGRMVARPQQVFAFNDHYVPTTGREKGVQGIAIPEIRNMVLKLQANTAKHGVTLFGIDDPRQGILHIVPPEQGITQPGLLTPARTRTPRRMVRSAASHLVVGASDMMNVRRRKLYGSGPRRHASHGRWAARLRRCAKT